MSNDFARLNDGMTALTDAVSAVAAAIRNPGVNNNDQAVIDDLAGRLEAAVSALGEATAAEDAEDAGTPVA